MEKFRFGNWGMIPHANCGFGSYENNPNYCTDGEWKKLKDCGFNYAIQAGGEKYENTLLDLEFAERAGMKILPKDHSKGGITSVIMLGLSYERTKEELRKREPEIRKHLDSFRKYSSFAGINAYDEPAADKFGAILASKEWFSENYPGYEFYVNLLPVYANAEQLFGNTETGTYEEYVKRFADNVNPSMLCYDNYSLAEDGNRKPYISVPFMYNLSVFAKECKDRNLPFYVYIQTLGFYDNIAITKFSEFAWQAYTALAFGVKGILCFQYWTILEDGNNVHGGIVERDGTINPLYYFVQKVFSDIRSFEDEYMEYSWNGVMTFAQDGDIRKMFDWFSLGRLGALKYISAVKSDANILVGEFRKDDRRAYVITNVDLPFEPTVKETEISFREGVQKAILYQDGKRMEKELKDSRLTVALESGSAVFIIPIRK